MTNQGVRTSDLSPGAAEIVPGAVPQCAIPSGQGERHFKPHEKWANIHVEEDADAVVPGQNHSFSQTKAYHQPDPKKRDEWKNHWQYSHFGFKSRPEYNPADPIYIAAEFEHDRRMAAIAEQKCPDECGVLTGQDNSTHLKEEVAGAIDKNSVLTPKAECQTFSEKSYSKKNTPSDTSDDLTLVGSPQRRASGRDQEADDNTSHRSAAAVQSSQSC